MFLGIDLGTSELKAVLLSDRGVTVGSVSHALTLSRPRSGWAEQDPDDWWRATCAALSTLRNNHPAAYGRIRAIGLSGQMHGAVLLDGNDRVLRPAILWNDMRCVSECDELLQRAPMLHDLTGNWAMLGFTAPKLMWVARHEPDIFRKLACVLLPKDYLRLRLTGERLTDPSDASGTLWLDVERRAWSVDLLQACGLSCRQVPAIVEGSSQAGVVRARIASDLGLPDDVTVAGGRWRYGYQRDGRGCGRGRRGLSVARYIGRAVGDHRTGTPATRDGCPRAMSRVARQMAQNNGDAVRRQLPAVVVQTAFDRRSNAAGRDCEPWCRCVRPGAVVSSLSRRRKNSAQ